MAQKHGQILTGLYFKCKFEIELSAKTRTQGKGTKSTTSYSTLTI